MLPDRLVVPGDQMGPKERNWRVNGCATLIDDGSDEPLVLLVEGEVPLLSLPASWATDQAHREAAYGIAMMDVVEQQIGWLAAVRRFGYYVRAHELEEAS